MSNDELVAFMLDTRPSEYLDLYDKRDYYKQTGFTTKDLKEAVKLTDNESQLYAFWEKAWIVLIFLNYPWSDIL